MHPATKRRRQALGLKVPEEAKPKLSEEERDLVSLAGNDAFQRQLDRWITKELFQAVSKQSPERALIEKEGRRKFVLEILDSFKQIEQKIDGRNGANRNDAA